MAVYKPTYCYPYLNAVDIRTAASIPSKPGEKYIEGCEPAVKFLSCKIDTSNSKITGYSVKLLDENNHQIFPVNGEEPYISPISELQGDKIKEILGIDSLDDQTNSGINGTQLQIPFFQNDKKRVIDSYNAIYYKPRVAVSHVLLEEDLANKIHYDRTPQEMLSRWSLNIIKKTEGENWIVPDSLVLGEEYIECLRYRPNDPTITDRLNFIFDGETVLEGDLFFVADNSLYATKLGLWRANIKKINETKEIILVREIDFNYNYIGQTIDDLNLNINKNKRNIAIIGKDDPVSVLGGDAVSYCNGTNIQYFWWRSKEPGQSEQWEEISKYDFLDDVQQIVVVKGDILHNCVFSWDRYYNNGVGIVKIVDSSESLWIDYLRRPLNNVQVDGRGLKWEVLLYQGDPLRIIKDLKNTSWKINFKPNIPSLEIYNISFHYLNSTREYVQLGLFPDQNVIGYFPYAEEFSTTSVYYYSNIVIHGEDTISPWNNYKRCRVMGAVGPGPWNPSEWENIDAEIKAYSLDTWVWSSEDARTITITDGETTNPNLIKWLQRNAVLVENEIIDLTGTSWLVHKELPLNSYYSGYSFGINFSTSENSHWRGFQFNNNLLYYGNTGVYQYNSNTWAGVIFQGISPYQKVEIWGGADVKNKILINWFKNNASLIIEPASQISYDYLDEKYLDIKLNSGTILGSTPNRIQIASDDPIFVEDSSNIFLPSDKTGEIILQGTYVAMGLGEKDLTHNVINPPSHILTNSRFYVKSYDSLYGHVYPQLNELETLNLEDDTHCQFFKHSNNPDEILDTDMITWGINKNLNFVVYNEGSSSASIIISDEQVSELTSVLPFFVDGDSVLLINQYLGYQNGAYNYYTINNEGAKEFSSTTSYKKGDLVKYEGDFWRCRDITEGVWDSDKWFVVGPIEKRLRRMGGYNTWAPYLGKIFYCIKGDLAGFNIQSLASSGTYTLWDPTKNISGSILNFTEEIPIMLFPQKLKQDRIFDFYSDTIIDIDTTRAYLVDSENNMLTDNLNKVLLSNAMTVSGKGYQLDNQNVNKGDKILFKNLKYGTVEQIIFNEAQQETSVFFNVTGSIINENYSSYYYRDEAYPANNSFYISENLLYSIGNYILFNNFQMGKIINITPGSIITIDLELINQQDWFQNDYIYFLQGEKHGKRVFKTCDLYDGIENWDLYTACILRNHPTLTYISPYTNIKPLMALKFTDSKQTVFYDDENIIKPQKYATINDSDVVYTPWIKILSYNSTLNYITHAEIVENIDSGIDTLTENIKRVDGSYGLASYGIIDNVPWKYEIRSYFTSSNENLFYAAESSYLRLNKNGNKFTSLAVESLSDFYTSNIDPFYVLTEENIFDNSEIFSFIYYVDQEVLIDRSLTLSAEYCQFNQISWESYRWILFDENGNILQDTGNQYDGEIEVTFYGLSNTSNRNKIYYVELIVTDNINNTYCCIIKFISAAIKQEDVVIGINFTANLDKQTHSVVLDLNKNSIERNTFVCYVDENREPGSYNQGRLSCQRVYFDWEQNPVKIFEEKRESTLTTEVVPREGYFYLDRDDDYQSYIYTEDGFKQKDMCVKIGDLVLFKDGKIGKIISIDDLTDDSLGVDELGFIYNPIPRSINEHEDVYILYNSYFDVISAGEVIKVYCVDDPQGISIYGSSRKIKIYKDIDYSQEITPINGVYYLDKETNQTYHCYSGEFYEVNPLRPFVIEVYFVYNSEKQPIEIYKDSEHTEEIEPEEYFYYLDKETGKTYIYYNNSFKIYNLNQTVFNWPNAIEYKKVEYLDIYKEEQTYSYYRREYNVYQKPGSKIEVSFNWTTSPIKIFDGYGREIIPRQGYLYIDKDTHICYVYNENTFKIEDPFYKEYIGEWEPVLLRTKTTSFRDFNIKAGHSYQYIMYINQYENLETDSLTTDLSDIVSPQIFANYNGKIFYPQSGKDVLNELYESQGYYELGSILNSSFAGEPVRVCWDEWALIELVPEKTLIDAPIIKNTYQANLNQIWLLKFSLETGSQTQNISRSEIQTLGQYPKVGMGQLNYISGEVTALLGNEIIPYSKERYIERMASSRVNPLSTNEKIEMLKQWRKLISSKNPKLLTDMKGQSWIIQIFSGSNKPQNFYYNQPDTISFQWKQIGNLDNVIVYGDGGELEFEKYKGSSLWESIF